MKKIVIVAIAIGVILMGITYSYVADIMGDDLVNLITIIAALAILILAIGVSLKYINQIKNDTATGELADDNWDGIGEYKNELPIGWALSFLGTMIWAAWYWTSGYPLWAYSQIGEWNEEVQAHSSAYEAKWANASQNDLENMGKSVFLVQCAPCHGIIGDGMDGKAADLTHRMSEEGILDTILNGANNLTSTYPGGMPAGMVSAEEAPAVAKYVANGMRGERPDAFMVCAGCHGEDGKGIAGVGPNIVAFDNDIISAVLKDGKKGVIGAMPSYDGRLTPVQVEALTTYINTL